MSDQSGDRGTTAPGSAGADRLRRRLVALMDDGGRRGLGPAVLTLLSRVYGGAMALRADCYARRLLVRPRRLPATVICVGNLAAGGTGKTPMAVWLARRLQRRGLRVAVVSRGYGGRAEKRGGVVSDGRCLRMDAAAGGDEPVLMARSLPGVPVVVGADRYRAGMLAIRRLDAAVLVLDDAFQHLALERDFNLVLMDAARPFGNGRILPRGTLREPLSALGRAHAVVLTRADGLNEALVSRRVAAVAKRAAPAPVFTAAHDSRPCGLVPVGRREITPGGRTADAKGLRALAFSGIARNDCFFQGLVGAGYRLSGRLAFADHHRYADQDRTMISETARRLGAELLVTTEKDYVRFAGRFAWPLPLLVMGVEMRLLAGEDRLLRLLDDCLASSAPAHGGV